MKKSEEIVFKSGCSKDIKKVELVTDGNDNWCVKFDHEVIGEISGFDQCVAKFFELIA